MRFLTAAAGCALALSASALTVVDDIRAGATPADTLVAVRERIHAIHAKDAKEKVVLDLDFGAALNAECAKFDDGLTCFWRGTDSLAAAKARAEATGDRPRSTVGQDLLAHPWWREVVDRKEAERETMPDTVDLVLIGDSITHWWEKDGGAGTPGCYDKLASEFLVHNLGLCGDRTENVIWRLEKGALDGYRTKTAMIMIGTNNGGDSEEEVAAGVKRIVEIVREKQPQAKILLLGIFPRSEAADDPQRARIKKINAYLKAFAEGEQIAYMDFGWKFLAPDGTLTKAMMHDGLHPSPSGGYPVWYKSVLPWLRAAIPEGGSGKRGMTGGRRPESELGRLVRAPQKLPPCFVPSGRVNAGAHYGFDWWVEQIGTNRQAVAELKDRDLDLVLFGAALVKNWTRQSKGFGGAAALAELFRNRKGLVLGLDEDRMESTLWRAANGELDGFTAKWIVVSAGERNWYATPEELAKGYGEIVKTVRAKHPESKVIVMGMFPQGSWRSPVNGELNVQQRAVNKLLKKLDDGKTVFFLDISDRLRLENGDTDPTMMPKDIHPSPKMFDYWRRELERVMNGAQLTMSSDQRWRNLPWDDVPTLLYVSPTGDDAAVGTKTAPLKTLAGARDRLRRLRAGNDGKLPGGAIVTFLAGEYLFDGPVVFTSEDSGTPESPVIYRAERPHAVSFSGAQRPVWTKNAATGLYEAMIAGTDEIPGFFGSGCCTRDSQFYIEHPVQLYQDGERLTCARWPNKGAFALIKECYAAVDDLGGDTTHAERFRDGLITIADVDGNVKDLTALAKENEVWAWGTWFTQYADAVVRLTKFDLKRQAFAFDDRLVKHGWRRKAECYVFNALSELDEPGEWVIDRAARKLYLKPLAGKKEMPVVSIVPTLVRAKGLSDVVFDGFTFEYARDTVMALDDCRDVEVRTATFRHTSNDAIEITDGANCRVVGCDLYDLGKGGIRMRGGSLYTRRACGHTVDNCHIHHYGQVTYNYEPAIGMYGTGCRATHNLIHHSRHQGIQFKGNLHYIGYNVLHDLCMHNGDAGAIYSYNTTGAWQMRGNVIEYNAIHMVGDQPRAYMCDGIYLDAFVSGTTVRGNLVNRATQGIFSSGGQDNVIDRNVVMRCFQSIRKWNLGNGYHPCSQLGADSYIYYPLVRNREIFEMGFWKDACPNMLKPLDMPEPKFAQSSLFCTITSNALVATSRVIFSDAGCYFNDAETGPYTTVAGNERFEEDPGFVDYFGGNWELRDGSPLRKLLGGGTRFGEMGLYDSSLRASPAIKWGADMTPIRKLKREQSAAEAWLELFWKGDLPAGVTECSTDRAGCEYLAWGTKGKVICAKYGRVPHDKWQTYSFAFTPTADGEFKFEIGGAWGEKTRYDDFVATGCELVNGDFSASDGWTVPPPQQDKGTYDRPPFDDVETFGDATEPYGIVNGEGVANQFRRLVQMVRVKKGQRVTFTFKARGFDDPALDY